MALTGKSLFLYGYSVTSHNNTIDFKASLGGETLSAVLNTGDYSLNLLLEEVVSAMEAVDPDNVYTATALRTYSSNTENRITISIAPSTYLSLLFSSGPNTAATAASLLGFNVSDYTGSTSYTGAITTGTAFIPTLIGYNYLGPLFTQRKQGVVTESASGWKEAVIFSNQKYIQVEYKYNPEADVIVDWFPFLDWSTAQKPFDFTPNYETSPCEIYSVTLDKTSYDGKGMAYQMKEMLPQFPFLYDSGLMTMKLTPSGN